MPNPFDQFDAPGGLDLVPLPEKPKTPAAQTPAQAKKDELEVQKLEKELQPAGAAGADPFQNDVLLKQVSNIRELAKKPFSLGAGTGYLTHIPIIGQNAADIRAKLQQVQGDLIQKGIARLRELNGGKGAATMANTEQEGARIAASFAALDPSQSPEQFVKGLDDAEAFYKRALAQSQGQPPAPPAGKTDTQDVTRSAPLPIVPTDISVGVSTSDKAVIDPRLEKIKPQLEQYLAADPSKVSNAMILGFIKKNGLDPSTLGGLQDNLKFRMSKERKGVHWFPNVDPHFSKPLSDKGVGGTEILSEKDRAEGAASPAGATLLGIADVGTRGAIPDVAGVGSAITGGNYGDTRREFRDKINLSAYNQPGPTAVGNLIGALTTGIAGAPQSFPGLVASAGKQGGVYGFLSSDDPSFGGRLERGISDAALNAVAAGTLDPALRGVGAGVRKGSNAVQRFLGTPAEDIANANALGSFASHAPTQDIPAMRARSAEQANLGGEPTGLNALDRPAQDYVGRQVARSPGAREAADKAVATAHDQLPAQIESDFNQAIDAAAGDKNVATFLKRPAREITKDIQDMAGREYEAGIEPIKNERLTVDPSLTEALSHEQATAAIGDALRNHKLSPESRAILRSLPQWIKEGVDLSKFPVTVDALKNVATALDRRGAKLQAGSEGGMTLGDLSDQIRQSIGEQFPEYAPVNALYASRKRAIGSLEDARRTFLGDSTGEKTDTLAKATSRMSSEPGAPEFKGAPSDTNGFQVTKPQQNMPSEKQMAIAGAKEATVAKAANGSAEKLTTPGQKERNRLILGERADALEARSGARAKSISNLEKIQSASAADDTGGKVGALIKAAANLMFHRGGAAAALGMSGTRGMGPDDAARVVKILTTPGKASDVISSLEKAYGRRKARFIIDRIASMTLTANKSRTLPDEAVQK